MQVKVMLVARKVNQVSFENSKQGKPSSTIRSIKNRYPTYIWAAKYLKKAVHWQVFVMSEKLAIEFIIPIS